jgi:hypothetical protein
MDANILIRPKSVNPSGALTNRIRESRVLPIVVCLFVMGGNILFKSATEYHAFSVVEDIPESHYAKPLKLLLPITIAPSAVHVRWTTTGMVVVTYLNRYVFGSPRRTALALNILLVLTSFWASWIAFRSITFSFTFTTAMGFGTQFHYANTYTSCLMYYLLCTYIIINVLSVYKLYCEDNARFFWKVIFGVSLVATALCWETWLDYCLFLMIISAFLLYFGRKFKHERLASSAKFIILGAILIAVPYLAVRLGTAENFVARGNEAELIINYGYKTMMAEDFVYNIIGFLYSAISNFFPPQLVGSNSLRRFGADIIIAEQQGYHPQYSQLVPMHHFYLWQFNAGIVFALFSFFTISQIRKAVRQACNMHATLAVLSIMVFCGFATHSLIKFHPANALPACSYKVTISILAFAMLYSYALMLWTKHWSLLSKTAINVAVFIIIIFGAMTRPAMLQHQHALIGGLGPPDPLQKWKQ